MIEQSDMFESTYIIVFVMFDKKVQIILTSESDKKGRDETKQRGVDKFW